jgi:hypothetical protein
MFAKYRRQLTLVAIAFVIFFLINQPTASADLVKNAMSGLGDAAHKLAEFVSQLVS